MNSKLTLVSFGSASQVHSRYLTPRSPLSTPSCVVAGWKVSATQSGTNSATPPGLQCSWAVRDRKSTRLNSSHTVIYTLSLHDALPISSVNPLVRGGWLEGLGHPIGYEQRDSTGFAVLVGRE